ncbi:NAD(P)/FAD-dependent oxidoreductase [Nocardioides sp.]|uniref:NAD(P)/FAD-dependent oxidoreductase n=1 Tax=Nocardioides sp. TaxID=35761 RepID=UPI0039E2A660
MGRSPSRGVVIVGGSVAGIRTARALRANEYAGRVRVVEAETEPPYDKPPLSKVALGGEIRVPLITEREADDLGIELLLGRRVTGLRPAVREVDLDDGAMLEYDDLVIATGLRARPAPWSLDGVHVLRTLADARAMRDRLVSARRVLVVGAGFIGAEMASLCRERGLEVVMVDPVPVPMARVAGPELGERLAELHRVNGVDTRYGLLVAGIEREGDGLRAALSDGSTVSVDVVIVGIGAELDRSWLEPAGVPVADGVVCDERGRVRGVPHLYAVGDVASWHQPRRGARGRVEHWTNAIEQANCVAHNLAHPDEQIDHDPVTYVWSDQYDWKLQLFGVRDPARPATVIERAEPFRLVAVWEGRDGGVSGGLSVNWPKASAQLRRAIARGTAYDEACAELRAGEPVSS